MSIIATIILTLTMSTTANQVWAIEYDGQIYEYVADRYDNPDSYIVTVNGDTIYIRDIIGGDNA